MTPERYIAEQEDAEEANAEWDAMTPEEQAAETALIAAEYDGEFAGWAHQSYYASSTAEEEAFRNANLDEMPF